jgi:hypothetical protein
LTFSAIAAFLRRHAGESIEAKPVLSQLSIDGGLPLPALDELGDDECAGGSDKAHDRHDGRDQRQVRCERPRRRGRGSDAHLRGFREKARRQPAAAATNQAAVLFGGTGDPDVRFAGAVMHDRGERLLIRRRRDGPLSSCPRS